VRRNGVGRVLDNGVSHGDDLRAGICCWAIVGSLGRSESSWVVVVEVRSCVLVAMLMQLVEGAIGLLNAKLRRRHVQRNHPRLLTKDNVLVLLERDRCCALVSCDRSILVRGTGEL
jgi:hypothetical protein